ncbi:hypothetical protein [uncultured Roseobacter sp.]|uniref:hypothetical protein n=1 Tax=uncultured Roseobacter sp. TaxID=114847 RepID=UPI002633ADB6|nr:hypothetical protein [uncultured Roseobacter sp.]
MRSQTDTVLILGSGPNAIEAQDWPKTCFDRVVVINNAWKLRSDWDDLICPEDFPEDRRPTTLRRGQRIVGAEDFVPAQNALGGFVFAGGTMAFTAGYWALHTLKPRKIAWMGCDMVYPRTGPTHFYGTGTADPLRPDVTLQDLGAKSARLALLAAEQGCACVNLSTAPSRLLFPRARAEDLRQPDMKLPDTSAVGRLLRRETALGYDVPSGRYWEVADRFDPAALAELDAGWLSALGNVPGDQRTAAA